MFSVSFRSVFPHTSASLVFENDSLGSQQRGEVFSVPLPTTENMQMFYGTFDDAHLLPRATTRVQMSGSQTGALHQTQ